MINGVKVVWETIFNIRPYDCFNFCFSIAIHRIKIISQIKLFLFPKKGKIISRFNIFAKLETEMTTFNIKLNIFAEIGRLFVLNRKKSIIDRFLHGPKK